MLYMEAVVRGLKSAVQSYFASPENPESPIEIQNVTAINIVSRILGFEEYRQAKATFEQGLRSIPIIHHPLHGKTYLMRVADELSHVHSANDRPPPTQKEVANFAVFIIKHHDEAVLKALDGVHEWAEIIYSGRSTIITDTRLAIAIALQRKLANDLSRFYSASFGVIDEPFGMFSAKLDEISGLARLNYVKHIMRSEEPNSIFRARVNHSASSLALPVFSNESDLINGQEVDTSTLTMCNSIHLAYNSGVGDASLRFHRLFRQEGVDNFNAVMIGIADDCLTVGNV